MKIIRYRLSLHWVTLYSTKIYYLVREIFRELRRLFMLYYSKILTILSKKWRYLKHIIGIGEWSYIQVTSVPYTERKSVDTVSEVLSEPCAWRWRMWYGLFIKTFYTLILMRIHINLEKNKNSLLWKVVDNSVSTTFGIIKETKNFVHFTSGINPLLILNIGLWSKDKTRRWINL